jgi:ABC-2 type transport system permease protein
MIAIFKREMRAYFLTPIGYIYMGFFLLITGIFFAMGNLRSGSSYYTGFLSGILLIYLFAVPFLTMRLFSEEKRQKTDQLLLTSPISISEIVLGKFLAALALYCLTLLVTLAYALTIAVLGDLQGWETLGSYIGFIFLGAGYISVGVFVSASTENQITAALVTFFSLLVIWMLDPLAQVIPSNLRGGLVFAGVLAAALALYLYFNTRSWIVSLGALAAGGILIGALYLARRNVYPGLAQRFLGWFSLNRRYQNFSLGLLKADALVYYASFSGFFLFLTVRLIEKRRWG